LLNTIKKKVKSLSGDKKSVLALVGGTTIAQGLNFVFSPIQTRLFTPEVFGELSVFTSITGIIGVIICLRYELAIVLPQDDDEGFNLLKLSWFFALIVSFVSLLVFGLFRNQIYSLFNVSQLGKYWYYVPITLILTGIIQASNYWLTRQRKFTILSYNKVLPVLALNLVSIGLGFAGNRALGARLFSVLVSNIVNIAVLAWALVPDLKIKREIKYSRIDLIKKYRNFLVYDIWGALINTLSWMIVPILMNYYYGSFAAGQYSIGMRVLQIPVSLIGTSMGQVFLKTANEKKYAYDLYRYTIKYIKRLFIFTSPISLLFLFFAKPIFCFTFGENWAVAGSFVQILAPWTLFWFISTPVSSIYSITQKQNYMLIVSIMNLLTRFISLFLGFVYNNVYFGITILMVSGVFTYFINFVIIIRLSKQNDF